MTREVGGFAKEQSGKATIAHARRFNGGFLSELAVSKIAADPETRLDLLLVRCNNGRFLAPARDIQHFVDIIDEAHGRTSYECVRDISLPATVEASK